MSAPIALAPPCALSLSERLARLVAVAAVGLLLVLTRARPNRLRRALHLRRSSSAADLRGAERARDVVTTVSLHCASEHGCLRRSLAIIVLCRLSGAHATWRVGFRSLPPQTHSWVEAGGEPIHEIVDPRTIYTPILTV